MTTLSLFPIQDHPLDVSGPRLECFPPASWVFRLPRELKSPNRSIWRGRWALWAERKAWEREIDIAIGSFALVESAGGWTPETLKAWIHLRDSREKRAVRITRLVPSTRNFLRDSDNAEYASKHLIDALTRGGLIFDDSRAWLDRAPTREMVSPDGKFWTVVQLDRPDVRASWRRD